jgi:hypothetical protein
MVSAHKNSNEAKQKTGGVLLPKIKQVRKIGNHSSSRSPAHSGSSKSKEVKMQSRFAPSCLLENEYFYRAGPQVEDAFSASI